MEKQIRYFVVFAEMRTGSNFLEESLNQIDGISCLGEVFNPAFVGHAGKEELFGIAKSERDRNPNQLLHKIVESASGIPGFRFFHDHDPRILDACLADDACAKIVLTRNPVDTYVSKEIVAQTGQWRLSDAKNAKTAKATFDKTRFTEHLNAHVAFQQLILQRLQATGQTAFYLDYEDISSPEVMTGLAKFLGRKTSVASPSKKTKKQNPGSLQDRVSNFDEMEKALQSYDYFGLNRTPNFEPRRGPMIPSYVAAPTLPLLFSPIPGGPTLAVRKWLAMADSADESDLVEGFSQKSLRQWKRRFRQHLSFTVVTHPVERLFISFCEKIAVAQPSAFHEIRLELAKSYDIPLAIEAKNLSAYTGDHLRDAFLGFARFLKGNLNGQTNIRVDPAWASQTQILQGFAEFACPDHVLRRERLESGLRFVAEEVGLATSPPIESDEVFGQLLPNIYSQDVEAAVKAAYQKDYMMFGYGPWKRA